MNLGLIRSILVALLLGSFLSHAGAVQETKHFRFHEVSGQGEAVTKLLAGADARIRKLCTMLDVCHAVGSKMDVWIADDAESFAGHFPPGNRMAERAVGVAFPRSGRIVLRSHGSALFTLSQTFDHEISHVLVHRAAGGNHVPRWFLEGLAIWQAGESVLAQVEKAAGAAWHNDLFEFDRLDRHFPDHGRSVDLAYAQSAIFVRWLYGRHGVKAFSDLLGRIEDGQGFGEAFDKVYGSSVRDLSQRWSTELREKSSIMMFLRDGNFLWVMMAMLIVWAYFIKRRERKAAIEAMGEREALADNWAEMAETDENDPPTIH